MSIVTCVSLDATFAFVTRLVACCMQYAILQDSAVSMLQSLPRAFFPHLRESVGMCGCAGYCATIACCTQLVPLQQLGVAASCETYQKSSKNFAPPPFFHPSSLLFFLSPGHIVVEQMNTYAGPWTLSSYAWVLGHCPRMSGYRIASMTSLYKEVLHFFQ